MPNRSNATDQGECRSLVLKGLNDPGLWLIFAPTFWPQAVRVDAKLRDPPRFAERKKSGFEPMMFPSFFVYLV